MMIGGLIIAWANNESVFMAMIQALVTGAHHTATIIWHSHRTTHNRMQLLSQLAREQIRDATLNEEIQTAVKRFKGLSGLRNFYCHCSYDYSSEMQLRGAQGISLTQ